MSLYARGAGKSAARLVGLQTFRPPRAAGVGPGMGFSDNTGNPHRRFAPTHLKPQARVREQPAGPSVLVPGSGGGGWPRAPGQWTHSTAPSTGPPLTAPARERTLLAPPATGLMTPPSPRGGAPETRTREAGGGGGGVLD